MTREEHTIYDDYPHRAQKNPGFKFVFEIAEMLRREYYQGVDVHNQ